jgi:hypothetical protein
LLISIAFPERFAKGARYVARVQWILALLMACPTIEEPNFPNGYELIAQTRAAPILWAIWAK